MKKILVRLSLVLLVLLVLLIGSTLFITQTYKRQIGEQLLAAVNQQLVTEARVQDFDLSLFRRFPNVTTSLIGLEVTDTRGERLCYASELSATLSPFGLFSNTLKLKSIYLEDARINILINRQGKANYTIFKEAEGSGGSSSMNVSLEKAALEDIELFYQDQTNDIRLEGLVRTAVLSGNFSADQSRLRARAELQSRFLERSGERLLVGTPLAYNGRIAVNRPEGSIQLNRLELQVGPNAFLVDGQIQQANERTRYDLELTSQNGSLGSLVELLPEKSRQLLKDVESRGDFDFRATVKGETGDHQLPAIQAAFSLEDGRISSPRFRDDFKDVSLLASFSNGGERSYESAVLEIRKLKGYFNNELIEARLKLTNLNDPFIQVALDGVVPMKSVYPSLGSPNISAGSGEVEIKGLQLAGRLSDMMNTARIHRVRANGNIEFDNAMLKINDRRLILDRGRLQIRDNDLSIADLKFEGPDTELEFKGSVQNLLPVLFADSVNSQLAELTFQADLVGEELAIDQLLAALDLGLEQEEKEALPEARLAAVQAKQVQARQRLTNLLNGQFNTRIESFSYGQLQGEDFQGKLQVKNNKVNIEGTTKTMDGEFYMDGTLHLERYPRLEAELEGKQIDVGEFFRQCANFGQDALTGKQLSGTLNTKIALESHFDELGQLEEDKLHVLAAIGIQEGELKDFAPLQQLSGVIKEKDLNNIRFSDLQNFMEIRKGRIYIPVMFIQSSAINLTLNGVHRFDNSFSYNIKANLLQALGQKIRRHDRRLDPIKARKKGFVNLYFHVEGDGERFEMESARRRVLAEFEQSSTQRRTIRLALEDRFGYVKMVDEPVEWRDIPEYQADPEDDSEEFIDWEKEGGRQE